MRRVLLGACRVARRQRTSSVRADHLLVSLLRHEPELRRVLTFRTPDPEMADRRLGPSHLVIGGMSPELELELQGALREAHWKVFGLAGRSIVRRPPPTPPWDPEASDAVALALRLAASRGLSWSGENHLLEALLAEPGNSAGRFLRQRRVDLSMFDEAARRLWPPTYEEARFPAVAYFLRECGVLVDPTHPGRKTGRWLALFTRLAGHASPVLVALEHEAIIQAVRLAQAQVTTAHLLLAIILFEEEMATTGLRPRTELLRANDIVLLRYGVSYGSAVANAAAATAVGAVAPPRRGRPWRTKPDNPPWTVAAADAAERARTMAAVSGVPEGSLHLLLSILERSDEVAARLMVDLDVDVAEVIEGARRHLAKGHAEPA